MTKIERRMTKQKKIILEILRKTKCHPTADWIYEQAKKELADLSLGTVYRNLNRLEEEGQILELSYGSTYSRYDGNPENHYHFVCLECSEMYDIDIPIKDNFEKIVEKDMGFDVDYHRIEFYGICKKCKDKVNEI